MSKINPLYFLAFFVLVALLMIYKVNDTQDKIITLNQSNIENEAFGKQIGGMKERWKNPRGSQQRIESILAQSAFKSKIIKKEKKRNVYHIALNNLDGRTLDSFTNKLLNEAISIKKISIERFSESNATISVECEL